MMALKKKKQELLASQVSNLVSDTNENLLRINLSKFFTDLEADIQKALIDYWNNRLLLQGQVNLILAPIHEKHQEYYDLLMEHKLQEFNRSKKTGERLVKRARDNVALKSTSPVKFTHTPNNLFGTLEYTEDKLANDTFTASEHTLNRVDDNINEILTDGYRQGYGINDVSRRITERFDQLRTWEATRIARTEIHTAQNMGMMSSYESLGVEYTQWTSAHDKRTRISHREIDGEIIPFGGMYSNKLRYPGDKSGRIEEWINCRCTNAPFIPPSGMMAPPGKSHFRESDLVPMQVMEKPQMIEDVYEPPSDDFVKQINYIREGNWSDPNAMMDRIDRLGDRKTNKLTDEEIESLQHEAQYYVEQDRIRYEELQLKLEEMEERLEEEYYPKGSYLYDELKKDIKKTRKEVKKLSQYY